MGGLGLCFSGGVRRLIGDAGARWLLGDWMRESWAWEGVGRLCAKRGSCAAFMACCRDLAFFAFVHMFFATVLSTVLGVFYHLAGVGLVGDAPF